MKTAAISEMDILCHCCRVKRFFFDDFGYVCQKCGDVHCTNCLDFSESQKCKKCNEKLVHTICLACKNNPIKSYRIHEHHINWRRFGYPKDGKTIQLCSKHHPMLHKWIENEAIKICLKENPNFFETKTDEYIKGLA